MDAETWPFVHLLRGPNAQLVTSLSRTPRNQFSITWNLLYPKIWVEYYSRLHLFIWGRRLSENVEAVSRFFVMTECDIVQHWHLMWNDDNMSLRSQLRRLSTTALDNWPQHTNFRNSGLQHGDYFLYSGQCGLGRCHVSRYGCVKALPRDLGRCHVSRNDCLATSPVCDMSMSVSVCHSICGDFKNELMFISEPLCLQLWNKLCHLSPVMKSNMSIYYYINLRDFAWYSICVRCLSKETPLDLNKTMWAAWYCRVQLWSWWR